MSLRVRSQVLESLLNAMPEMVIDVATSSIGQKLLPYMFDYCHEAAVPDFLMKFFLVQVYLPGLGVSLRARLSKVVCAVCDVSGGNGLPYPDSDILCVMVGVPWRTSVGCVCVLPPAD
jgi:hypothetical protein